MILTVDVGNTSVMSGIFSGDNLVLHWKIKTSTVKKRYQTVLKREMERKRIPARDIQGVIVSSVVPPLNAFFANLTKECFKKRPLFISARLSTGMPILYPRPEEVGADRIANAIGAFEKYGGPVIVIDTGTATTFDVINEKGEYMGGAIAPGMELAARALFKETARLPFIHLALPRRVVGRSTRTAMISGIYYGAVGQIKEILMRIKEEAGWKRPKVILTGGQAGMIDKGLNIKRVIDPQLTLEGLRIIEERVRKTKKINKKVRK